MSNVLVCVLTGGERSHWLNPYLVEGLLQLQSNPSVKIELIKNVQPVARARNTAVMKAREQKVDWLVMVDCDNTLPLNNQLLSVLDAATPAQDVIGFPAGTAQYDKADFNLTYAESYNGKPFIKVKWIGTGCMALRKTVWERLCAGPWFESIYKSEGELGAFLSVGEDQAFCFEALKAGLGVFASICAIPHFHTTDLTALAIQQKAK